MNSALNIEHDPHLTQCILKLAQVSDYDQNPSAQDFEGALETCRDAIDVLLRAFAINFHYTQSTETESTFQALQSLEAFYQSVETHYDYEAGKHLIEFLIKTLKAIEKAIINYPDRIHANKTEIMLGLNDALGINRDTLALLECVGNYAEAKVIMDAMQAQLDAGNYTQAISEFLTYMKLAPSLSASCATTIQGVKSFVRPLAGSFIKHPIKSVERLVKNLVSEPFGHIVYILTALKEFQMKHDRKAGEALGNLIMSLLDGLH